MSLKKDPRTIREHGSPSDTRQQADAVPGLNGAAPPPSPEAPPDYPFGSFVVWVFALIIGITCGMVTFGLAAWIPVQHPMICSLISGVLCVAAVFVWTALTWYRKVPAWIGESPLAFFVALALIIGLVPNIARCFE